MPIIVSTSAIEKVNGHAMTAEPRFDPIALAEAAAIRARSEAETEARLITAQAEADAVRVKAEQEAERQRIINERAAMKQEKDRADHAAHLAEVNRKREETERLTVEARATAEAEEQAEKAAAAEVAAADSKWRAYALGFYILCAVVALPVQVAAFWNPSAWWLVVAPIMLEGGAWVVLKGAAAAVTNRRPHWHYRLIAWLLAFIAAGVNLAHGLHAFDPVTAVATALASVAGPGVWDLHEHGRIRKRDGVLTRRERKAQRDTERKAVAEKAATEKRAAVEQETKERAAVEAAGKLASARSEMYPKVWEHALKLAAALGETTVTEAVWKRAYNDIEGTDPGDSVDVIRGRNIAARRVQAARSEAPGNTPSKVTSTQRAPQMPPVRKPGPKVRATRRPGDTPKYAPVARKQAAITARTAASGDEN
jgi:hypothetical protein